MTNKIEVKNCDNDDIISFDDDICKVKKIVEATWNYFSDISNINKYVNYIGEKLNLIELNIYHGNDMQLRTNSNHEWFDIGKECELLKEGKRWQKGKLRLKLTLEFIPDEPEENANHEIDNITDSPLDEIRQQLTNEHK
ncbi:MAG: KGK domain-containing protein [Microcoleaceae cyanobacterium]